MDAELSCKSCRKRVQMRSMKYSKDGSGLICQDCSDKEKHGINVKLTSETPSEPEQPKKKIAYYCRSCNFRFARAIDFRGPRTCPNCNKDTIIANLPSNADDLLRELDRMDDI